MCIVSIIDRIIDEKKETAKVGEISKDVNDVVWEYSSKRENHIGRSSIEIKVGLQGKRKRGRHKERSFSHVIYNFDREIKLMESQLLQFPREGQ